MVRLGSVHVATAVRPRCGYPATGGAPYHDFLHRAVAARPGPPNLRLPAPPRGLRDPRGYRGSLLRQRGPHAVLLHDVTRRLKHQHRYVHLLPAPRGKGTVLPGRPVHRVLVAVQRHLAPGGPGPGRQPRVLPALHSLAWARPQCGESGSLLGNQ